MKKTTKKDRNKGIASRKPTEEVIVREEEIDSEMTETETKVSRSNKVMKVPKVTSNKLQDAIILSEILGTPVSKRRDRRSRVGRI